MLDINLKGAWLVARRVIPVMIAAAVRCHHQQLVDRRAPRHGAAQPLRRLEVGTDRPDQVLGHRAGPLRHPGQLDPSDRRKHPDERWPGRTGGPDPPGDRRASAGNLLPVPWIEPEDVAHAVLYLASERARYVTGAPFVIDAGLLSR